MKYLKYFENNFIQQPFFLSKGDKLYVSDDLAKSLLPSHEEIVKIFNKNNRNVDILINKQKDFLLDTKTGIYGRTLVRSINIYKSVTFNGMYKMNILLSKNKYKNYNFFINGNSGDSEMHGKNMIRATRECNLKFMIKLYPIVDHIKNFYRILYNEDFLDIIKEEIEKDHMLAQYGIPEELQSYFGDLEKEVNSIIKYNI